MCWMKRTANLQMKMKFDFLAKDARDKFYISLCWNSEEKENGTYLLLSKFEEDVVFEYHITIQDENFNLGILTMRTPEGVFEVDFDAE